jgi:hypothetical protein
LKQNWFDVDLWNVPTKGDVRIYMRNACLWPYLKEFKDLDQYAYGGDVAVHPKFMSSGLGAVICYYTALDMAAKGYQKCIGTAINKFA